MYMELFSFVVANEFIDPVVRVVGEPIAGCSFEERDLGLPIGPCLGIGAETGHVGVVFFEHLLALVALQCSVDNLTDGCRLGGGQPLSAIMGGCWDADRDAR